MHKIYINKNNLFDYIRLYAAFQVLIHHGRRHLNFDVPAIVKNIFSYEGVPIFFAISGFLITISWINSNFNFKKYFFSRFMRIFPALWISVFISFLLIVSFGKYKFAFSLKGLIWCLSQATFFTYWNPNELRDFGAGVINGSLWTIPVELQFYILVPFLIWIYIKLSKKISIFIASLSLVTIAALSVLIGIFIRPLPPGVGNVAREGSIFIKFLYVSIPPYLNFFIVGMLLALVVKFLGQKNSSRIFLFLGIIMISLDAISRTLTPIGTTPSIYEPLSLWIYPIYTALIFVGLGLIPAPITLNFDISYGLYLYHMLIANFILKIEGSIKLNYTITYFLLSIALAFISWYLIESPMLNLKKKYLTLL